MRKNAEMFLSWPPEVESLATPLNKTENKILKNRTVHIWCKSLNSVMFLLKVCQFLYYESPICLEGLKRCFTYSWICVKCTPNHSLNMWNGVHWWIVQPRVQHVWRSISIFVRPSKMMMTMHDNSKRICEVYMGVHITKESNSCMEQSVTFKTNKVRRDASGWVIVDSGLAKFSFILGLLDSIWLWCNSTIHNDAPPDVFGSSIVQGVHECSIPKNAKC